MNTNMEFIKLFEQYVDEMITESFQSDVIRKAVTGFGPAKSSMSSYHKKYSFAWDKIKDTDLQEVDVETAKKLKQENPELFQQLNE